MKLLSVLSMALVALVSATWADKPSKLDPANATDRAKLIAILNAADEDGRGQLAAKKLAQGNCLDELREVLRTTDHKPTIHAIAGTQDVRLIPAFAKMLRENPTDARLAGPLAHMKSPRVASALLEVVSRNPDDGEGDQERALEAALASLRAITHGLPCLRSASALKPATLSPN